MGGYDSLDDAGHSKRHFIGAAIHLPTQDYQSYGERKKWERIQASHCGFDA